MDETFRNGSRTPYVNIGIGDSGPLLDGEQHLRQLVYGYVAHYNAGRNHQGIDNRLIEPGPEIHAPGAIVRKRRFDGLLSYYHGEAVQYIA